MTDDVDKPAFDPSVPFDEVKPAFDPSKPFDSGGSKEMSLSPTIEPGLEESQSSGRGLFGTPQNFTYPSGVDPKDVGINDAGQRVNMKTGEVIPETQIQRPSVVPLAKGPQGIELAMPKAAELAGSLVTPLRGIPKALPIRPAPGPFGITLSGGEQAGDLAMRQAEEAAIRSGDKNAQKWVAQRKEQIGNANTGVVQKLDPFGQTIVDTPQEAGQRVTEGVRGAAASKKAAADKLYEQARTVPGEIDPSVFDGMGQQIKKDLFPKVVFTDQSTPIANQMVNYIDNTIPNLAKMNPEATEGSVTGVNLSGVDEIRKTLNLWKRDAFKPIGDADTRATREVLDAFDNNIDAAVNGGKFTGDKSAVDAWNDARSAYADYKKTFTARDPVGRKVQQIIGDSINEPMDPTRIMSFLATGKDTAVASRLKSILGESSPEWIAAKQGLAKTLLDTGEGEAGLSTGQRAQKISKFLNSDMAGAVYSPQEQEMLRSYAGLMRQMTMPPGSYIPSGPAVNKVTSIIANRSSAIIGALIGRAAGAIGGIPLVGELVGLTAGSQVEKAMAHAVHGNVAKQLPIVSQQLKQWQNAVSKSERSYTPKTIAALTAASENLNRSLQPLGIDIKNLLSHGTVPAAAEPEQNKRDGGRTNKPNHNAKSGPPMHGARKAPDGHWYLADKSRPGKYLRVET